MPEFNLASLIVVAAVAAVAIYAVRLARSTVAHVPGRALRAFWTFSTQPSHTMSLTRTCVVKG